MGGKRRAIPSLAIGYCLLSMARSALVYARSARHIPGMTTFYLVRHGSNDFYSHTLVGRRPGVLLNAAGRREAEDLAEALAPEKIQHILTSPMERCRETAAPMAKRFGLEARVSEALNEVDFGDWTNRTFAELNLLESWKQWNVFRSGGRAPGGETMLEVQSRMIGLMAELRRQFAGQRIALVGHGDPLGAALLFYLGTPLEFIRRIELSPASVTVLTMTDWEVQVRCVNRRFNAGIC
jgi:broad specificity phosphatase PhoE